MGKKGGMQSRPDGQAKVMQTCRAYMYNFPSKSFMLKDTLSSQCFKDTPSSQCFIVIPTMFMAYYQPFHKQKHNHAIYHIKAAIQHFQHFDFSSPEPKADR